MVYQVLGTGGSLQRASRLSRSTPSMWPVDVRNEPIKAGFCLFCLGNKKRRPSKRMVQFFISPPESHNHVEAHLSQLNSNFKCEHPPCLVAFGSTEALTYHHLMGTHRWRLRHESPKKRKFELEDTPWLGIQLEVLVVKVPKLLPCFDLLLLSVHVWLGDLAD